MNKRDQNNSVKIESGVSLPPSMKYQFDQMQINDSFAVPFTELASVRRNASYFGMTRQRTFTVRKTGKGSYRCWRVS